MKKLVALIAAALTAGFVFAASYTNNTYQKLAQEYTDKAQKAMDAGEYDLAEEYAVKAQENAELSEAYIKKMMAKADADANMKLAEAKINYAKSIKADSNFPLAYKAASASYQVAQDSYAAENYLAANEAAKAVLTALADIREITPLPKFYIVRPWAESKDCFWNISGRPYVYNNPTLWENLYEANRKNLPQPNNPNLILPGMKMEIPSISGEYRDGVYSPKTKYDAFSANR